jgi:hypothetical protein
LTVGDLLRGGLNALLTKIAAYCNAIPGTAISAATIPTTALAACASHVIAPSSLGYTGNLVTARTQWIFTIPTVSGASNSTLRLHGCGIGLRAITLGAGDKIEFKKGGNTKLTIALDNIALTAAAPLNTMLGTPEATASGDVWTVVVTLPGSGTYTDVTLTPYWSLTHITQPT